MKTYNPNSKMWTIKWWFILKYKAARKHISDVYISLLFICALLYEKAAKPAVMHTYKIGKDACVSYFEPFENIVDMYHTAKFNILNFKFKRWVRLFWQRRTRGWDDSETWSLDYTMACFIYPRLKRFRELVHGKCTPMGLTIEQWDEILGKMEDAFFLYTNKWKCEVQFKGEIVNPESAESQKIIEEGLDLYHEYYRALWW